MYPAAANFQTSGPLDAWVVVRSGGQQTVCHNAGWGFLRTVREQLSLHAQARGGFIQGPAGASSAEELWSGDPSRPVVFDGAVGKAAINLGHAVGIDAGFLANATSELAAARVGSALTRLCLYFRDRLPEDLSDPNLLARFPLANWSLGATAGQTVFWAWGVEPDRPADYDGRPIFDSVACYTPTADQIQNPPPVRQLGAAVTPAAPVTQTVTVAQSSAWPWLLLLAAAGFYVAKQRTTSAAGSLARGALGRMALGRRR